MPQNGTHKPTVNGVIKGSPGKGRVYTLGQRKMCYASHRLTEDNIFRYTAKPTKANPDPIERQWCKRCRAASRKRSAGKRLEAAKAAASLQRGEAKAQLDAALPPNGKGKAKPTPITKAKARAKVRAKVRAKAKAPDVKAPPKGRIGCGECSETFPDPPTATKHFAKAHGKRTAKVA